MTRIRFPFRNLLTLVLTATLLAPLFLTAPVVRALPSPPVLFTPGNGSTATAQSYSYPPTGTPTLVWLPCAGASRYVVQICRNAGCSDVILTQETYNTSFTPRDALADGAWYWRARCLVGNEWSDYSSTFLFTKSWLDYGALKPALIAPPDTTVEFFEGDIFSWTPVVGAAYYRFEIFNQDSCQGNAIYNRSTVTPRHTPQNRLVRGDYWWRVTPVDRRNHDGSASECRHFYRDYQQRPTLRAPLDDSTHILTPDFAWTAVKGARDYHLQINTAPNFAGTMIYNSYILGTRYTHHETLPNDQDFYWRVAARDTSGSEGPWSPSEYDPDPQRVFYMYWHLVPPQLTPTYNFLSASYPVFQWTPVAGAKSYWFQMADHPSFADPNLKINATEVPNPYYVHTGSLSFSTGTSYYWRVKARDARGYQSDWSDTGLFQFANPPAPTQIYPPYYYDPETISATQMLDLRTDLTVPVPVFMWDRVVGTAPAAADSYLVQIDTSPNFPAPLWSTTTQNLSIAPSLENGFSLAAGTYYWRVRGYVGSSPMGQFSEPWLFKFDPQMQAFSPTIFPYFPADATDSVYDTPLFGWAPIQGAARYHFQISTSATDFSAPVHEGHPLYGFYTPQQRLAPDTYYWRVRAQDSGGGYIGDWTAVRRIVILYPLRRGSPECSPGPCPTLVHPILYEGAATRVGSDPAGDAYGSADYDLTDLYLARDDATGNTYWFITLALPPTNTTPMYFVVYVDLDHAANSGGATDPKGFNLTTDPIFRPERAFYAYHNSSGEIESIVFYNSSGSGWQPTEYCLGPAPCHGGGWSYQRGQYLEMKIPISTLDLGETSLGTVSLQAFTVPYAGGGAYDTVPSEPAGLVTNLTNFTAAADKVNLFHPWDNPILDPTRNLTILHDNPLLSFSKPLYRWWTVGYQIQVARDPGFQNPLFPVVEWYVSTPYPQYWFLPTRWGQLNTFEENNSLYWRVRIKHCSTGCYGPWSQPTRFTKVNLVPEEITMEYLYTLPTMRWARVEGVQRYQVEIDDDANFGSVNASIQTMSPSWTPNVGLGDRVWYWRIRVQDAKDRWSGYYPPQSTPQSFVKTSPTTALIAPIGGVVVNEQPTLSWQYLLTPTVNPVMYSPRYKLVLDDDPNFSPPYLWEVTLDSNVLTPDLTMGGSACLPDGTYYWKVALVPKWDSTTELGPWSATGTFYKAYPLLTPLSATFDPSPNLKWAAQQGAAYYELDICRDAAWSNCVERSVNTDQTSYVSPAKYTPGTYYWRVRMCDYQGKCGPYYEDLVGPRGMVFLPMLAKGYRK